MVDYDGAATGSRRIDPITRQHVLRPDGRAVGMPNLHQLVHLAVQTDETSSAIRDLGHRLGSIKVIGPNFKQQVLIILTQAVKHLIDAGLIEVLGFSSFVVGPVGGQPAGRALGIFALRDLTTGKELRVPI